MYDYALEVNIFAMSLRVGIDIGSTTVKVVVLDQQNKLLFRSYERHFSKTRERACETLKSIQDMLAGQDIKVTITGSPSIHTSPTPTPSSSWAARTPRSSSSAAPWRSG